MHTLVGEKSRQVSGFRSRREEGIATALLSVIGNADFCEDRYEACVVLLICAKTYTFNLL